MQVCGGVRVRYWNAGDDDDDDANVTISATHSVLAPHIQCRGPDWDIIILLTPTQACNLPVMGQQTSKYKQFVIEFKCISHKEHFMHIDTKQPRY